MSGTVAAADPHSPSRPAFGPPRRPKHLVLWVALVIIVLLVTGAWIRDRVEEDRLRQPLEVVQRASAQAHRPIAVLSPSDAREWTDGSGPTEQRVQSLAQSGNAYLEPVFYYVAGRHGDASEWTPPAQSRCYYFPSQRGSLFDADGVSALIRLCYVDGTRGPSGSGWVAVQ
jgi:hypothetical protein